MSFSMSCSIYCLGIEGRLTSPAFFETVIVANMFYSLSS